MISMASVTAGVTGTSGHTPHLRLGVSETAARAGLSNIARNRDSSSVRRALLSVAYLAAAVVLTACGPAQSSSRATSPSPSAIARSISGTLELHGRAAAVSDSRCYGYQGYDDIDVGTQVTVTNEDGTLIGTGALEEGAMNAERTVCTFAFTIDGLPDAAFYAIEVSHRGELTYSASEMADMNWQVAFTLGD